MVERQLPKLAMYVTQFNSKLIIFKADIAPQRASDRCFNMSLQHSTRTSNYAEYKFSDKSANLFLQVAF